MHSETSPRGIWVDERYNWKCHDLRLQEAWILTSLWSSSSRGWWESLPRAYGGCSQKHYILLGLFYRLNKVHIFLRVCTRKCLCTRVCDFGLYGLRLYGPDHRHAWKYFAFMSLWMKMAFDIPVVRMFSALFCINVSILGSSVVEGYQFLVF